MYVYVLGVIVYVSVLNIHVYVYVSGVIVYVSVFNIHLLYMF